jgi:hypothetical protein
MRSVVVFEHVTLDGVMQAPGRPDEDRRDGFEHGGWPILWDPVIASVAEESMASRPALLFGRPARSTTASSTWLTMTRIPSTNAARRNSHVREPQCAEA